MKRKGAPMMAILMASSVAHAGFIQNVAPGSIRVIGPSGDVAFTPTNGSVISGCASSDFYIISSANNAKMMLGILLTAKSLGATVKIYVPDNPAQKCDAASGRPSVTDITLED